MRILVVLLTDPLGWEPVKFIDLFLPFTHITTMSLCPWIVSVAILLCHRLAKALNLESFVFWAIMGKRGVIMFLLFLENQVRVHTARRHFHPEHIYSLVSDSSK